MLHKRNYIKSDIMHVYYCSVHLLNLASTCCDISFIRHFLIHMSAFRHIHHLIKKSCGKLIFTRIVHTKKAVNRMHSLSIAVSLSLSELVGDMSCQFMICHDIPSSVPVFLILNRPCTNIKNVSKNMVTFSDIS